MNKAICQAIQTFIKSGKEEYKLESMFPIQEIGNCLKEIGFNKLELTGDEVNGWELDFWYIFRSKQWGDYTLSGSLHYGNFVLSKGTDE